MKTIKIIVAILTLSVMVQFADAQNGCSGNRVRMSRGTKGHGCHCTTKCVDSSEVATYQANYWRVGECPFICLIGFRNDNEVNSFLETALTAIYPNPASGIVTIDFTLAQQSVVTLEVFDLMGKHITTIAQDVFGDDDNEVNWDAGTVNPGIYFLQMRTDNFSATKRMSVIN